MATRVSVARSHLEDGVVRADEYRAPAKQCLQWAHEATSDDVCKAYLDLEKQWLETASKLDGLPSVRSPSRTETLNH
jgi:hypothetical protein